MPHRSLFYFKLAAAAAVFSMVPGAQSLNIVAMGDSGMSAVGARDSDGNYNYEDPITVSVCLRSPTAWPALYAASVGASITNVACAGSKVEHITNPRKVGDYLKWPWQSCPEDMNDYYFIPKTWSCDRMAKKQAEAITEDADLIFLGVGANDVGLSNLVLSCFVFPFISEKKCNDALNDTRGKLSELEGSLFDVLADIEPYVPSGAKVVVAYGSLAVLDVGYTVGNIDPPVDRQMRNLMALMNETLLRAASHFPHFVEVYTATPEVFAGHEVDPRRGIENPDRWITEPSDGVETFHWNAAGHEGMAAKLEENRGTFDL